MDKNDRRLVRYLNRNPSLSTQLQFSWPDACEYSTQTLATAFVDSDNSHISRFSCRFVNLRVSLTTSAREALEGVVQHLASLELQLVDDHRVDLNEKVAQLRNFSKAVLSKANELQGLHIGFGQRVSLPLSSVFHDLHWEQLHYLGIHMWSLHDYEIIGFLRKHPQIQGLRLSFVRLKDGSRWDRILRVIRRELRNLGWLSLFQAGYVPTEDPIGPGQHVFGPPADLGDSSSEEDNSSSSEDDSSSSDDDIVYFSGPETDEDAGTEEEFDTESNPDDGPGEGPSAVPNLQTLHEESDDGSNNSSNEGADDDEGSGDDGIATEEAQLPHQHAYPGVEDATMRFYIDHSGPEPSLDSRPSCDCKDDM
jgi:hypothetical protein